MKEVVLLDEIEDATVVESTVVILIMKEVVLLVFKMVLQSKTIMS